MKIAGRKLQTKPGDVVVEPGTPHNFWNKTDEPVRMLVPSWAQRAALAAGAPIGRPFGYRPAYQPTPVAVARPAFAA